MKPSPFRIWRENRLIERAMRNTPPLKAPEGLRQRLIQQARVAEADSAVRPAPRSLLFVGAFPAVALVIAACWVLSQSPAPQKLPQVERSMVARSPEVPEKAEFERPARPESTKRPEASAWFARKPRVRLARHHWVRPRLVVPQPRQISEEPEAPAPTLQVSVTRSPQESVGYARVATYTSDDSGATYRTAWTLTDDAQTGARGQEMIVDDGSGQRQLLLKVAVVGSSDQHKGEEL